MYTILKRLREPSTWSGLAGIMILFGMSQEEFAQYVLAVTGGISFLIAVVMPEKGGEKDAVEDEEASQDNGGRMQKSQLPQESRDQEKRRLQVS